MFFQELDRGILTKYMTEQPNDHKKPHGVDFIFNFRVPTKSKLRMILTFTYELLPKHLFLTISLVESMCFDQEEPSLGQFSNFSVQKTTLYK